MAVFVVPEEMVLQLNQKNCVSIDHLGCKHSEDLTNVSCCVFTVTNSLYTGFPLFCTHKIPGFFQDFIQNSRYNFLFFNVASTYNWVSVYTLYITSTLFCLHYPKVCIPPLTATHNDLYHFERWVLIKKPPEINDLMAAK